MCGRHVYYIYIYKETSFDHIHNKVFVITPHFYFEQFNKNEDDFADRQDIRSIEVETQLLIIVRYYRDQGSKRNRRGF